MPLLILWLTFAPSLTRDEAVRLMDGLDSDAMEVRERSYTQLQRIAAEAEPESGTILAELLLGRIASHPDESENGTCNLNSRCWGWLLMVAKKQPSIVATHATTLQRLYRERRDSERRFDTLRLLARGDGRAKSALPWLHEQLAERQGADDWDTPFMKAHLAAAIVALAPDDPRGWSTIRQLLDSPHPRSQWMGATAVRWVGRAETDIRERLVRLQESKHAAVVTFAVAALWAVRPNADELLPVAVAVTFWPEQEIYDRTPPNLSYWQTSHRTMSVRLIGEMGPLAAKHADRLCDLFETDDPLVHKVLSETLGKIAVGSEDVARKLDRMIRTQQLSESGSHGAAMAIQAVRGRQADE